MRETTAARHFALTHCTDKYAGFLGEPTNCGEADKHPTRSRRQKARPYRTADSSQPAVVLPLVVGGPVSDMAVDAVGVIPAIRGQLVLRRDVVDVDRGHLEQNTRRRKPFQE